jgi:hypothetical protein
MPPMMKATGKALLDWRGCEITPLAAADPAVGVRPERISSAIASTPAPTAAA